MSTPTPVTTERPVAPKPQLLQAPPAPEPEKANEAIRVKVLKFANPTDVPGADVLSSLKGGGAVHAKRWEIHYCPWMRHFRVAYIDPNATAVRFCYVHESQVRSWERE